jgi:NADH-quinone oxidoreductase subunit J
MTQVLFYIFGAITLAASLMVITRRNPVSAALYLVLAFFCLAGIYVLMDAFFLAAVQVAVYAGAIMVLFLFVIMLLNLSPEDLPRFMTRKIKWASVLVTILLGFLLLGLDVLRQMPAAPGEPPRGEAGSIGEKLFGDFLLPFEITAVLLLVAIVGSVIMARRVSQGE